MTDEWYDEVYQLLNDAFTYIENYDISSLIDDYTNVVNIISEFERLQKEIARLITELTKPLEAQK